MHNSVSNTEKDKTESRTRRQFAKAIAECRELFEKKLKDYGTSWRIMRPESLTDQIMIKGRRIRSLEEKGGTGAVGEGIIPEFIGIVNYSTIALIQLEIGAVPTLVERDLSDLEVMQLYDKHIGLSTSLMLDKNHDYDEAWRDMRVSSFTDIILQKILRTKEIEDHHGNTLVSEGVEANYRDMTNYALFALVKLVVEPGEDIPKE